jgi:acyl transferase domain-containing protein/NADPH:quinone reductase-like Zn-dependent oxidoreductase/acyl carrier protein
MVEVAIIGIGCRLPGKVRNPEQLWDFLLTRGDGIIEVPTDRWNLDRFYDPDPNMPGRMYTRSGGFLQDSLWDFDPEFFGVSPREASIMDPQQRLLLEVTQEAMDDAGVSGRVAGRQVGVYVGGFMSDNNLLRHIPTTRAAINAHTPTAGTFTMLSNRISFVYDLRGPSMTIDTACSSSLVALHEATQAITRGEIEMALVGGVNAMLAPETFVAMCKGRFLAEDGHCKTFDAAADGYGRGEGAGVLVLKPLADATRDHDRIYAVIKGTGVNQDGRTPAITVPNPDAQTDLIRRVTAEAGVRPEHIGYVEAHGTGTAIGDPLEMAAIGAALGRVEGRTTDLVVGSIKNSIGHLEAAAGVASVIKAALTLHHRQLAPQATLNELNPAIPFAENRLRVITEAEPFPTGDSHAAASVNGFGYGGTNAHAVLVAAPGSSPAVDRQAPLQVLPVSGRNEVGARQLAQELLSLVSDSTVDPVALTDAMWSRRCHHNYRFAVPFSDRDDLRARLTSVVDGSVTGGRAGVDGSSPTFVYSGMGPQWWRMGRDLLAVDGPFAQTAADIDEIFTRMSGWSLIDELSRDEADSRVTRTEIAQPANFLVQAGLTTELAHYGVRPAAVVGHSVGEVSAAYVSGMLSLEDAVTVSYHRSRLQATTAGTGGMLAVGLSEAEALEHLGGRSDVCIAAINSPSGVTLAGTHAAIAELSEQLSDDGIFARELRVEVPYHSHLMDPILPDLTDALSSLNPQTPVIPLYSTVTGAQVTGPDWGADYWCANVRKPVLFAAAATALTDRGERVFLEIGPHPVLSANIKEILLGKGSNGAAIGTLRRDADDHTSMRTALADLYAAGALDTDRAPGSSEGLPPYCPLPSHQFQRVRLWSVEEAIVDDRMGNGEARALPGDPVDAGHPEWRAELAAAGLPWLRDHVVADMVLLPGAAYLDCALAAAAQLTNRPAPALDDVRFVAPLVVEENDVPTLRLTVEPSSGRFTASSRGTSGGGWTRHATGRIVDGQVRPVMTLPAIVDGAEISAEQLYPRLAERGLQYGPFFQRIVHAQLTDSAVLARLDAADTSVAASNHQAHPTVLDAALQCVALLSDAGDAEAASGSGASGEAGGRAVVPAAVRRVRQFAALTDQVMVGVTRRAPRSGEAPLVADVVLTDTDGEVLVELHRVQFRPISPRSPMLNELDRLWVEPVFEPRPPRDPDGRDKALAGERALLVAAGDASSEWAREYADERGTDQLLTVHGGDPAQICADVEVELRRLLAVEPDDTRPIVVTLVAATSVGMELPEPLVRVGELPAMLTGVARAVQNVQDEALLDGTDWSIHGLVITRGVLPVPGDPELPDLAAATLVGARRVLRNEQASLNWRLIDTDQGTSLSAVVVESLVSGSYADDDTDEVALRDELRMVIASQYGLSGRLEALEEALPLTDPEANFEIETPRSGLLADLALREVPRRDPGPGEIELRIEGLGLNYKDPMKVMGVLTEKEMAETHFGMTLGLEGIGVVTRVGPGVSGFTVGEPRWVSVPGMSTRYLTTSVDSAAGLIEPGNDLPLESCGSVVALMTAHYAVKHAARVRPSEWVLVACGAGGVGMAAVQIAANAGARVIATASNAERADVLRSVGAMHVVDSRSLTAIDEVRRLTSGRGVDVVVSSAPGEAMLANLDVAAEFGRVVEVGKSESYGARLLDLTVFAKNLSLTSIDLDRMARHRMDLFQQTNREVLSLIRAGEYELLPARILPVSQLAEGFDLVARSNQVGRVVLNFSEPEPPVKHARPTTDIRSDGAYLVTGGLGDFGLATATWLASKGAGTIVLAGRRGVSTAEQQAAVNALRAGGADVQVEQLDVSDRASVDALLTRLSDGLPLRGVFHAAGVLVDEPFSQLSQHGLNSVLSPKARGALILSDALANTDLDHFVLYSSVTSQGGMIPQTSYAAANAVLDCLAHNRAKCGLPALAVNWGSLAGGMATSNEEISAYLRLNGLAPIPLSAACEYLDAAIGLDPIQVSIADLDWVAWATMHPASAGTPRFAAHVTAARAGNGAAGGVRAELVAMPTEQRAEVLTYMLAEHAAGVLGIPAEAVDCQTPLPELGLDSLMAVELRARVSIALDVEISPLELTRSGGLSALASRLGDQLVVA